MPVATERRRNAPKRGGTAGPKVDLAFAELSVAGFATDVALCVLLKLDRINWDTNEHDDTNTK